MADLTNTDLQDDYTDDSVQGDGAANPLAVNPQNPAFSDGQYAGDDDDEPTITEPTEETEEALVTLYNGLGFEDGRLLLDDQEVNFNNLTAEQRQEVIADRLAAEREAGFAEAEQALGLSNEEKIILNHYREHGTLEGVEVAATPPIAALSHDDLHRAQIRVLLGADASEQDVNASLESRRASTTFVREAEAIRAQMGQQAVVSQQAARDADFAEYVQEVRQASTTLKNIGGIPVSAEHLDYVIGQLTERATTESISGPFIEALSNPTQLVEYATKALLFDSVVEGYQQLLAQRPAAQQQPSRAAQVVRQITGQAPPSNRTNQRSGELTNEELDNPFAGH